MSISVRKYSILNDLSGLFSLPVKGTIPLRQQMNISPCTDKMSLKLQKLHKQKSFLYILSNLLQLSKSYTIDNSPSAIPQCCNVMSFIKGVVPSGTFYQSAMPLLQDFNLTSQLQMPSTRQLSARGVLLYWYKSMFSWSPNNTQSSPNLINVTSLKCQPQ